MNSLRFVVGEIAIYSISSGGSTTSYVDQECTVICVGPWNEGQLMIFSNGPRVTSRKVDYVIQFSDGMGALAQDIQLRKLKPPIEPDAIIRHEEIET
jgi:hypothetical protein